MLFLRAQLRIITRDTSAIVAKNATFAHFFVLPNIATPAAVFALPILTFMGAFEF